MRRLLYPSLRLETVWQLTPEVLGEMDVGGMIFDIDNTLVYHGAPADARTEAYFAGLHAAGIRTFFVSNNGEARVRPFAEALASGFCCRAHKPGRRGFETAVQAMQLPRERILTVGDQIFTDIWGAGRSGIRSVLVTPLGPKEPFGTKLKRFPEKIVLFFFKMHEKCLNRREK